LGGLSGYSGTAGADAFTWGAVSNSLTTTYFTDDWIISNTAADYPIGAGSVYPYVPTSDGSHNVTHAGDFIKGSAGANITNATTDSYQLVDDFPMDDTTPDTDDYVSAVADTGGGSEYVEHVFGIAGGLTGPATAPRAVEVAVAYHQASTGTGNSTFKLNDNGTESTIFAFNAAGVTTTKYARKHYATAPTGGAWISGSSGNGAFGNLRHRFGYSTDGNPDQYFDCAMVEAEFADIVAGSSGNGQGFFALL
jgi:hypothetical protein